MAATVESPTGRGADSSPAPFERTVLPTREGCFSPACAQADLPSSRRRFTLSAKARSHQPPRRDRGCFKAGLSRLCSHANHGPELSLDSPARQGRDTPSLAGAGAGLRSARVAALRPKVTAGPTGSGGSRAGEVEQRSRRGTRQPAENVETADVRPSQ